MPAKTAPMELPTVISPSSAGPGPVRHTDPIMDDHIIYAISTIVLALTYAGHTWGLGRTRKDARE